MALDPNMPAPSPWVVPEWDDYITGYQGPVQIAPPPPQQLAVPAMPVQEEISVAAEPQALPPAEESQIEIHQPPPAQLEALMPPDDGIQTPPIPEAPTAPEFSYEGLVQKSLEAAGERLQGLSGEELGSYMTSRPAEEQAEFSGKIDRERAQFVADRAREEANITRRAQEDNALAYEDSVRAARQRTAELDAEAKQLADTDPLDSISGGQKILGVLASIIGGFTMAKTGRNVGLEAVNRIADQAAQQHAQKIQLNQRQRQAAGEQVGASHDLFKSQEVVRLAVYDSAIKKLESEAQGFDPKGTTAQRIMGEANQLRAARAEWLAKDNAEIQKREQQEFENKIKFRDLRVKEGELELKQKAQAAKLAGGGAGAGKAAKPGDVVQPPEYFEALYGKRPPISMSQNGYEEWAKTGKVTQDLIKAERENSPEERNRASVIAAPPTVAVDDSGNVTVKRDTGNLKQESGEDWIPNTPDEAKAFRKQKTAADGLIEILDEIRVIRDRTGGESSWGNSNDYQRLKVLKNRATKLAKAGTEGMSSDEDMKKIDAALGASDPASFRAQAAGLEEGRKGVERELDIAARNLGYTGKPITYTDPLKQRGAAKTTEQSGVERVLAFDLNDAKRQESYASELGIAGGTFARGNASDRANALNSALKSAGGILPSVKQEIDTLRETAADENAKPKAREFARESLDRIARESESETVRNYALANSFQMPAPPREEVE